jgi:hypothetical protein
LQAVDLQNCDVERATAEIIDQHAFASDSK